MRRPGPPINVLFPDLFAQVPASSIGIQLDGLKYDGTNYQPPTAAIGYQNAQQKGQPPIDGVPTPCWAYFEDPAGNTVVGFQSATGVSINGSNYGYYLQGLQYGTQFGAQYIELHPVQVNSYVNSVLQGSTQGEQDIGGVNYTLQHPHGNSNCIWQVN